VQTAATLMLMESKATTNTRICFGEWCMAAVFTRKTLVWFNQILQSLMLDGNKDYRIAKVELPQARLPRESADANRSLYSACDLPTIARC
jgi:hypothetical protein